MWGGANTAAEQGKGVLFFAGNVIYGVKGGIRSLDLFFFLPKRISTSFWPILPVKTVLLLLLLLFVVLHLHDEGPPPVQTAVAPAPPDPGGGLGPVVLPRVPLVFLVLFLTLVVNGAGVFLDEEPQSPRLLLLLLIVFFSGARLVHALAPLPPGHVVPRLHLPHVAVHSVLRRLGMLLLLLLLLLLLRRHPSERTDGIPPLFEG